MIITLVEIVILAAALAYVAWPPAGKRTASGAPELLENELSDLMYRKEAAYTALKDLEFDMRTGKIGQQDYDAVKQELEADAMSLLQRIDDVVEGKSAPEPAEPAGSREKKKPKFCPECGTNVERNHKFCPECASKL